LLAPISGLLGTLLLADAARLLCPGTRHAGLFAAAALNATLLFGAGAVTMTPDTPLLLFWIISLWALARFGASGQGGWLPLAGAAAGCALVSKLTAVFLGLGAAAWFVVVPELRPWLRRPWPWLAAALGLAIFAPVVLWNAAHEWISVTRQGGRLAFWEPARAVRYVGELIGGQIGLATPILFVLFTAGIVIATRRALRTREKSSTLLALLSVPPLILFTQHALGDRVQANWPAIVYPTAAIAAAGMTILRRWRVPAIALGAAITACLYVQLSFAPLTLSRELDPSLRLLAGWQHFADEVEAARAASGASFVVSDQYIIVAELAFHLPDSVRVVANDPRWTYFDLPHPDRAGQTALVVQTERRQYVFPPFGGAPLVPVGEVARGRDGVVAERYHLYCVVWPASADRESVVLPHRED
jgi:4-amino-4-deoxy-L-arabinose transferase-like glycosyltransferase